MAGWLRLPWLIGLEFALLSMLGDSLSSAWKRRTGQPPGHETFGVDQLPEALLPLILLRVPLQMGWTQVALVTAVFTVLDALSSGLRSTPAHGSQ
jgi:CDP-2,3-bis-(O-geranylgeranyl)-sn-glycerol synthase